MWQTSIIAVLTGALGFMVGHGLGDRSESTAAPPVHQQVAQPVTYAAQTCPDAYSLAQLVAEEVALRIDEVNEYERPASRESTRVTVETTASPAGEVAALEAQVYVDSTLSAGIWTDQHREDLDQILMNLSALEGRAVMQRIVGAINNGSLVVQTSGPPI